MWTNTMTGGRTVREREHGKENGRTGAWRNKGVVNIQRTEGTEVKEDVSVN